MHRGPIRLDVAGNVVLSEHCKSSVHCADVLKGRKRCRQCMGWVIWEKGLLSNINSLLLCFIGDS